MDLVGRRPQNAASKLAILFVYNLLIRFCFLHYEETMQDVESNCIASEVMLLVIIHSLLEGGGGGGEGGGVEQALFFVINILYADVKGLGQCGSFTQTLLVSLPRPTASSTGYHQIFCRA